MKGLSRKPALKTKSFAGALLVQVSIPQALLKGLVIIYDRGEGEVK